MPKTMPEWMERVRGRRIEAGVMRLPGLLMLVLAVAAPSLAQAQQVVSASPDVTLALGVALLTTSDEDVAVESGAGFTLLENLGSIPGSADVTAFGLDRNGDRLIAFDTTVELSGSVVASRGDVVRYDGASYATVFDASAAGVPAGATTDAVSLAPEGLLLSFDTAVDLGGLVVFQEDLVRWNGASFTLVFDGSTEGLIPSLDIDGAQDLGGGQFLVSFDTTANVGGVVVADEDIARFDGSSWSLEYDSSTVDPDWSAADLDALLVPEPGFGALIATGVIWIAVTGRSRPLVGERETV